MKTNLLFLALIMSFLGCQSPQQQTIEDPTTIDTPQALTEGSIQNLPEFEKLIRLHGIDLLYAFYCIDMMENIEGVNKRLGISLKGDIQYILRSNTDKEEISIIKEGVEQALTSLSEEERRTSTEKALRWLRMSQTMNGEMCGIDGETYYEIIYDIPALKGFIDKHIDPELGQSVYSLASGQMEEVDIDVWTYLALADRKERLSIISEFAKKCAELEGEMFE